MTEPVKSFRDLDVYQLAFDLQQEVFDLTRTFPREELYALSDQIRRSSRSIGANIAEAWHKRRYVAHFTSKLSDADGEQAETQHWLNSALACGYVPDARHTELMGKCLRIGRMLGKMMSNPNPWCRSLQ